MNDRFAVKDVVGKDGDLTTYDAFDTHLKRPARVRAYTGTDASARNHLLSAAEGLAATHHANIENVLGFGTHEGHAFVVTEALKGFRLGASLAEGGPLSPNRALAAFVPIVGALAAAHATGVSHGAINTDSVVVGADGRLRVTGFGSIDASRGPREDVRQCGVLLHRMLTGVDLGADGAAAAFEERRLPGYVDALVRRAAAPDPGQRPADAMALLPLVRSVADALLDGKDDDPDLVTALGGSPAPAVGAAGVAAGVATVAAGDQLDLPSPATPDLPAAALDQPDPDVPDLEAPTVEPPELPDDVSAPVPAAAAATAPTAMPQADQRRRRGLWALAALGVLAVLLAAFLLGRADGRDEDDRVAGDTSVTLTDLSGMSVEMATRQLAGQGLKAEIAGEEFSETVPAGMVIATEQAAGAALEKGAVVGLIVSEGKETRAIPDLAGDRLSEAKAAFADAGIEIGDIRRQYSDQAAGQVLGSEPSVGVQLSVGDTVDLLVSRGPQLVAAPNYLTWFLPDVREAAGRDGWEIVVTGTRATPAGWDTDHVLAQQPAPGTRVEPGSEIRVVLGR